MSASATAVWAGLRRLITNNAFIALPNNNIPRTLVVLRESITDRKRLNDLWFRVVDDAATQQRRAELHQNVRAESLKLAIPTWQEAAKCEVTRTADILVIFAFCRPRMSGSAVYVHSTTRWAAQEFAERQPASALATQLLPMFVIDLTDNTFLQCVKIPTGFRWQTCSFATYEEYIQQSEELAVLVEDNVANLLGIHNEV